MKFLTATCLLICAVCIVPQAAAEESNTANFRIGGVELSLPVPVGYCQPAGNRVDIAQIMAAADSLNVTHTTIFKCEDAKMLDYVILKTPIQALLPSIDRAEFLRIATSEFSKPETLAALSNDKIEKEVSQGFENVLNQKVSIESQIGYRGGDDACIYLGGYASYTNIPEPYTIALGMCMTTVEKKVVSVNVYGPPKDSGDVARLMARAREIALSINASLKD